MSAGERSLATSTGISMQGSSGQSTMTSGSGGPNSTDEQTEPVSSLSIFAIDYKK